MPSGRGEMSGECHQIRDRWHANALYVEYRVRLQVDRNLKIGLMLSRGASLTQQIIPNSGIIDRDIGRNDRELNSADTNCRGGLFQFEAVRISKIGVDEFRRWKAEQRGGRG